MASISLPEKGQPIDVNYIYEMASQINSLTNALAVRSSSSSQVNKVTETTGNLRFFAATLPVSAKTASSTEVIDMPDFNYSSAGFKTPPVVVATVVNNGGVSGVDAGNSATVILDSVGTSQSTGVIRFGLSGGLNISINVIALGIPT
jgi:hypothetical protein